LPSFAFSVTLGSAAAKGSGWTFRTLDLAGDRIMVLGKARWQKEPVTLPEPTKAALEAWLQARGTEDGPLFVNFDRAGKGGRLTGSAVYFIVSELRTKAGLAFRPHGLRHLAITSALALTKSPS
jgi:integrase/recombinase XerC